MRHTDREYEQELVALRDAVLLMGARVEEMTKSALTSFARLSFVPLMSSQLCCGGGVPSAAALMYVFSSGNCAATCCAVAATVQPSPHVACHLSSGTLSTVWVSSPSAFSN